jgi:hypothetical protein
MEIVAQMNNFLKSAASIERLTVYHIGFYLAICLTSKTGCLRSGFRTSRSRIMRYAHIRGRTAYHKYLKDLVTLGYLTYQPSYHPKEASLFQLKILI